MHLVMSSLFFFLIKALFLLLFFFQDFKMHGQQLNQKPAPWAKLRQLCNKTGGQSRGSGEKHRL